MRPKVLIALVMLVVAGVLAHRALRDRIPGFPSFGADPASVPGSGQGDARAPVRAGPLPGEQLEIELLGAPASHYLGDRTPDALDRFYAEQVARAAGASGARYDLDLGRAAREVAFQSARLGRTVPEAALTFLLHASGAPDLSAAQYFTHTTSEAEREVAATIARAIAGAPRGDGALVVGVGEASTPDDEYPRHIAVLVARRNYDLEPTPRLVEPGGTWTMRGRLPAGFEDPHAVALLPDGGLQEIALVRDGRRFEVSVPAPASEGVMYVGIDGSDRHGPGKLLQVSVAVAPELPRSATVTIPEPEDDIEDVALAEQYALALLNGDRARFYLDTLELDPELSAIARAHSEDMRAGDFFGHRSTRTGLAGDRIARAGYRAMAHGENLALNDSLAEAEAALMQSVGHRVNILSDRWTHVGIGVARRADGQWLLTQLFAARVEDIDPDIFAGTLLARVNRARAAAGERDLARDPDLDEVARRFAPHAAAGSLDDFQDELMAAIRGRGIGGSVGINALGLFSAESFEPSSVYAGDQLRDIGIGVWQSPDDPTGRVGVVILVN